MSLLRAGTFSVCLSTLLSVGWGSVQSSVGINGCFFPGAGTFVTLLKNQHVAWNRGLFTPCLHIGPFYLWNMTVQNDLNTKHFQKFGQRTSVVPQNISP